MRVNSGFRGLVAGVLAVTAVSLHAAPGWAQAGGAQAQGIPAPLAVVVDTAEVLKSAKAMAVVRDQSRRFETQFRNQLQAEEKALNDNVRELERLKNTLSPEAFAERKRAFDQSVADYQRRSRALVIALEKSNRQAVNQVEQMMVDIIGEVAQQRGANMVLSRSQVILYDPRMEITPVVLDLLNRKLPSVAFPTPVPEAEAAAPAQPKPAQPATKKK